MNPGPSFSRKLLAGLAAVVVSAIVLSGALGAAAGGTVAYLMLRGNSGSVDAPPAGTAVPVPALPQVNAGSGSVADAVSAVAPSVVTVVNYLGASTARSEQAEKASGSGVVISAEGFLVTNAHVVEGSERLEVLLASGDVLPAELVGSDSFADLAVLKIEAGAAPAASFGDSAALQPGDTVIAIGSPLGDLTNTVTVGVVSATKRDLETSAGYKMEGLLQTDAAINRGNSGGPLVDMRGGVVGINTLVVRGSGASGVAAEGLGFAIPADTVREITSALIANGRVERPYLGIRWEWITPQLAGANGLAVDYGAFVTEVTPNSPASRSGLQRGDVLTRIDGTQIGDETPFLNLLLRYAPGDTVTIGVQRGGSEFQVEVTLAERPRL